MQGSLTAALREGGSVRWRLCDDFVPKVRRLCANARGGALEASFCCGWDENVMSGRAVLHTPVDVKVAQVAGRQAGMVSTDQLRGLGIGRSGMHERRFCPILCVWCGVTDTALKGRERPR